MARKVQTITTLVDDLDGTPIEDGKGETIKFGLDGASYEIDLTSDNAKKFRRMFTDYVAVARKSGRGSGTRSSAGRNSKEYLAAVREWAEANGHEVSPRGRISAAIQEAYKAAQG